MCVYVNVCVRKCVCVGVCVCVGGCVCVFLMEKKSPDLGLNRPTIIFRQTLNI